MPRTREQNDSIREAMRQRILAGAVVCFATNGFSGTRISDLAKSVGIGQGTLYNYFASKEDVFLAILEESSTRNSASFDALVNAPLPATEKVHALSERMLEQIRQKTNTAYELVLNFRMGEERGSDNEFAASYGYAPTKGLAEIIRQGQQQGSVIDGDAMLLADYYWGVVHLLAVMLIIHNSPDLVPAAWLTRLLVLDTAMNA